LVILVWNVALVVGFQNVVGVEQITLKHLEMGNK
jgi:hypothetical protein